MTLPGRSSRPVSRRRVTKLQIVKDKPWQRRLGAQIARGLAVGGAGAAAFTLTPVAPAAAVATYVGTGLFGLKAAELAAATPYLLSFMTASGVADWFRGSRPSRRSLKKVDDGPITLLKKTLRPFAAIAEVVYKGNMGNFTKEQLRLANKAEEALLKARKQEKRIIPPGHVWKHSLVTYKCIICERQTALLPYCEACASDVGLHIKKGGVYAHRNFDVNGIVLPYGGEVLNTNQAEERYGAGTVLPYGILSGDCIYDAALLRSWASMIKPVSFKKAPNMILATSNTGEPYLTNSVPLFRDTMLTFSFQYDRDDSVIHKTKSISGVPTLFTFERKRAN